ncbi:2-oxoglutarate-Fe(II)-dependent oxygenase superfamily protein [Tahibacter aquaticus]|uniref:2-oxoglutarate-Fe(II)-dependent oxygenase superfamily protein n=1 Tax=Tahibacter aquaticus TaxID=520092 RepID=A0A4R6Z6R2_9GAMM|nr:2OG-Fe(II) oxygenase [Tahibacter aquaticus]TDR47460.1 2-oxoglutarate-Fe(II)-dependent oxygenase superfamily protein [Tahibacter aquaticus]
MQPDFIEVYEDGLDAETCQQLIQRFDASKLPVRGQTGGGVDISMKDSWDICITDHAEWNDAVIRLNQVVMGGLKLYLRKFAHAVLAPLQLKVPGDKPGELRVVTAEDVATMEERTLNSIIMKVFRPGTINIQKYNADRGGYPYWHCELYPKNDNAETLHRVVLWTIYLNDAFEEGETEFLYQQRKIVPRTGSLLIAPTAFTHTHRGNIPKRGDKYIATSWILFNRAEVLFGQGQAPKKK